MEIITKLSGRMYVIKFLKCYQIPLFLSFLVLNCIGNICPFVEKKKKEKALCLVSHICTKKPPTLFSQPCPTPPIISTPSIIHSYYNVQPPYYSNPSYYSGLEST